MRIVLVKLGFRFLVRQAVKIGKQIAHEAVILRCGFCIDAFCLATQIINQNFGVNFFLNVKRRRGRISTVHAVGNHAAFGVRAV